MENLDINLIIALLEKQRIEVEAMLYRRIFDLNVQLIQANQRIADLTESGNNHAPGPGKT